MNGIEEFFSKSNTEDKEWHRRDLGDGHYQITKVGARCEACRKHFAKNDPVFRSVRVEYQTFIDKDGLKRREFSWINSKCSCYTAVVYKNGELVLKPSDWFKKTAEWENMIKPAAPYSKVERVFDDLKAVPSKIELRLGR